MEAPEVVGHSSVTRVEFPRLLIERLGFVESGLIREHDGVIAVLSPSSAWSRHGSLEHGFRLPQFLVVLQKIGVVPEHFRILWGHLQSRVTAE